MRKQRRRCSKFLDNVYIVGPILRGHSGPLSRVVVVVVVIVVVVVVVVDIDAQAACDSGDTW